MAKTRLVKLAISHRYSDPSPNCSLLRPFKHLNVLLFVICTPFSYTQMIQHIFNKFLKNVSSSSPFLIFQRLLFSLAWSWSWNFVKSGHTGYRRTDIKIEVSNVCVRKNLKYISVLETVWHGRNWKAPPLKNKNENKFCCSNKDLGRQSWKKLEDSSRDKDTITKYKILLSEDLA